MNTPMIPAQWQDFDHERLSALIARCETYQDECRRAGHGAMAARFDGNVSAMRRRLRTLSAEAAVVETGKEGVLC